MSLAERLKEVKDRSKPPYELWVDELDKEDRVALLAAAADRSIPTAQILAIVRAEGGAIGKDALLTWRRANGFTG